MGFVHNGMYDSLLATHACFLPYMGLALLRKPKGTVTMDVYTCIPQFVLY